MKDSQVPELTRASSKGQKVIPRLVRRQLGVKRGSVFAVSARNNMIVLKKLETGIGPEDLRTLKLIEDAWKDIEEGRYKVYSRKSFLKEFKKW